MQFSIHAMGKLMPEFREAILEIDKAGFDCDYISERLLMQTTCKDGMLITAGGTAYKGLIIPGSGEVPDAVKQHIEQLKAQGAHVMYGIDAVEMAKVARPEPMKYVLGLKAIRRKNPTGHHYFMANLTPDDINAVCDVVTTGSGGALWFNPLNGDIKPAVVDDQGLHINLRSGESMILQTFDEPRPLKDKPVQPVKAQSQHNDIVLNGPWTLTFTEEAPKIGKTYQLDKLQTWETLDALTRVTMGTGVYTTRFKLSKRDDPQGPWLIDLGDVRESARVYINGEFIGCAWSVPFVLDTKGKLKAGENEVRIEVTNLPANRISELDRQGVQWRKMEEINVVDIHYKKTLYDDWAPMPSGLNSAVRLCRAD